MAHERRYTPFQTWQPAQLTRGTVQALTRAADVISRKSKNGPAQRPATNTPWNPGVKAAKTQGAISAGAANAATSGTAVISDFKAGTGTARSDTVTVYNRYGSTIASGTTVYIAWVDGAWHIIGASC